MTELLQETIIEETLENVGEEAVVEVAKNGNVLGKVAKYGLIAAGVGVAGYVVYKRVVKPLVAKAKAKKAAKEAVEESSTEEVNA